MDDSSDNAFSFAGHAAAAAGGEQSNSSQSVDRGRPPMMSAIADADPCIKFEENVDPRLVDS